MDVDDSYFFRQSLLSGLSSTTFSSSSIVDLRITMTNFDDCRYLLDGRLSQLHTFIVSLDYIYDPALMRVNPSKMRKISSQIKINTVKNYIIIDLNFYGKTKNLKIVYYLRIEK